MSTWKCCRECPSFYAYSSDCYRRPDRVMHVDDPSVCPEWCPQENRVDFPGCRHGRFPYFEETCRGCYYDTQNSALAPASCQHYTVRPLDEKSGPCPYHVKSWRDEPKPAPICDDAFPAVTRRFAEIIMRGVNEGDLSFWDLDSCTQKISIGRVPRSGCHRFCINVGRDGSFRVCTNQTGVGKSCWIHLVEMVVDKAEIVEDYGHLFLFKGDNRHFNSCCIAIRIVDAVVDTTPIDDDLECEGVLAEDTCDCSHSSGTKTTARLTSLEAFI